MARAICKDKKLSFSKPLFHPPERSRKGRSVDGRVKPGQDGPSAKIRPRNLNQQLSLQAPHSIFPKTEICAISFSSSDLTGGLAGLLRRSVDDLGHLGHQCDPEEDFFIWIRRNPLKSPVSAKGIQGNPSFFPWICLDFLAAIEQILRPVGQLRLGTVAARPIAKD